MRTVERNLAVRLGAKAKAYMAVLVGLIFGAASLLGFGATVGCAAQSKAAAQSKVRTGIIQIVEHPALDAARDGFIKHLEDNGFVRGKNLEIEIKVAQGDMSIARAIAAKFASDKFDLVLAIATPAAQAMASATKTIPILITAVTDPVAAGLVKSMERPGGNVTGTTDMNPVKEQLGLIRDLVPKAKRVGIIFNSGEVNSVVQVELARKHAKELGFTIVEAVASNSGEVMSAAQSLVGRVDAIYIPTDNTVVAAFEAVAQVARMNRIPVIAGESSVVERGGLATIGIDYFKLGQQTAEMALRILAGARPAEMPVEAQKEMALVLNLKAAKELGLSIPADLLKKASKVIE